MDYTNKEYYNMLILMNTTRTARDITKYNIHWWKFIYILRKVF